MKGKKKEEVKEVKTMNEMWIKYLVTIQFSKRLCGSAPLSPEMVKPWIDNRIREASAEVKEMVEGEALESIQKEEKRMTLGFQSDETGFFVRADTWKAHLKDSANQIRTLLDISGLKAKLANRINIKSVPEQTREKVTYQPIYLLNEDGDYINEYSGDFDRPIHTFQINALKTVKYVDKPTLKFIMMILNDNVIKEETLVHIFDYGKVHGYGGERSMQEGQYEYKLERLVRF